MLENQWYIAAESRELKKAPLAIMLFDKSIVIFRTTDGSVSALEDRCAHRNAPLSKGKLCAGKISCPYHGWTYKPSGELDNVPALAKEDVPKISVASYSCIEQQGYIWICLGDIPPKEIPFSFPKLGESGWSSFKMKTMFDAPVEQCLENYLDCPHATHVHNLWFRTTTGKRVKTITRTLQDGAEVEYFDEPREKSLIGLTVFGSKKAKMKHTDRFIAPSTSRVDYSFSDSRHVIITSFCTPISETKTQVYTVVTFKFWRINWLMRLIFEPVSRFIIKQDVKIMATQRKSILRFGKEKFVISKSDLLLPHILAWRNALSNGDAPPQSGVDYEQDIYL